MSSSGKERKNRMIRKAISIFLLLLLPACFAETFLVTSDLHFTVSREKHGNTFEALTKAQCDALIGNIDGLCDGCCPGLIKMYQDYIEGHKELREINMEFNARYTSGAIGPERLGCDRE